MTDQNNGYLPGTDPVLMALDGIARYLKKTPADPESSIDILGETFTKNVLTPSEFSTDPRRPVFEIDYHAK